MQSFKPTQYRELIDLKGQGTIHFLVSDLNPLFKKESYQRIATWLEFVNPRRFFFYPTGTLQRPSMELNAIVEGKYDLGKIQKESQITESATTNKILDSFSHNSSGGKVMYQPRIYRTKPVFEKITPEQRLYKLDVMRGQLEEAVARENERLNKLGQPTIAYDTPCRDLKNKEHRHIARLYEDLKQLKTLCNRQSSVKIKQLPSPGVPEFLQSPVNMQGQKRKGDALSYGMCIPWSTIVAEKTHYHTRKDFFNGLLKTAEEAEAFDALVGCMAEIRTQHVLSDAKNASKLSDPAWEPMIREMAEKLTREYLTEEIPFFITQFDKAKLDEVKSDNPEKTYFCYPMKGPLGHVIFEYVKELYARTLGPVPVNFIFVDTTDLMKNGTKLSSGAAEAVSPLSASIENPFDDEICQALDALSAFSLAPNPLSQSVLSSESSSVSSSSSSSPSFFRGKPLEWLPSNQDTDESVFVPTFNNLRPLVVLPDDLPTPQSSLSATTPLHLPEMPPLPLPPAQRRPTTILLPFWQPVTPQSGFLSDEEEDFSRSAGELRSGSKVQL